VAKIPFSCFPEALRFYSNAVDLQFKLEHRIEMVKGFKLPVACVASVFVGLSTGLKHFSLFERAKIGASAKKCCARPNFCAAKKQKCLQRAKKSTETLATQAKTLEVARTVVPIFCT